MLILNPELTFKLSIPVPPHVALSVKIKVPPVCIKFPVPILPFLKILSPEPENIILAFASNIPLIVVAPVAPKLSGFETLKIAISAVG